MPPVTLKEANQCSAIVAMLVTAPSRQLTTRAIARKLAVKPSTIVELLVDMRRAGLVERPFGESTVVREAPTDRTYRLTVAGLCAPVRS